jgi:hypothetical protein
MRKKTVYILLISLFFFSFRPSTNNAVTNSRTGFYVFVEDFTNRSNSKYIVDTKDSVNSIFNSYFNTELELGDVQNPIFINNGDYSFYIARVNVFEKANGKKGFKHFKYPNPYIKHKRAKLKPVTL